MPAAIRCRRRQRGSRRPTPYSTVPTGISFVRRKLRRNSCVLKTSRTQTTIWARSDSHYCAMVRPKPSEPPYTGYDDGDDDAGDGGDSGDDGDVAPLSRHSALRRPGGSNG